MQHLQPKDWILTQLEGLLIYAHFTNKMHKEAVDRLDKAFQDDSHETNLQLSCS